MGHLRRQRVRGGSQQPLFDEIDSAQTKFAETAEAFAGHVTTTSSPAEDCAALAGYDRAVAKIAADLQMIEPPEKVVAIHDRLVTAMTEYRDAVRAATASIRSGDRARMVASQDQLMTATGKVGAQINRNIDELTAALT